MRFEAKVSDGSIKTFQVSFFHSPYKTETGRIHRTRKTICKISLIDMDNECKLPSYKNPIQHMGKTYNLVDMSTGISYAHHGDQFCKRVGREHSLGKALACLISGCETPKINSLIYYDFGWKITNETKDDLYKGMRKITSNKNRK